MKHDPFRRFARAAVLLGSSCVAVATAACTVARTEHGNAAAGLFENGERVLRIGVGEEPDSLNPLFSHTAVADDVTALLFAPLFRYNERGDYVPELAVRVPTEANGDIANHGLRVVLRLRTNARWSDGAPLDVRDLIFTRDAVMNPANNTKLRAGWQNIARIRAVTPSIAELTLLRPDATVLSLFSAGGDAAYPLLPAHVLEKLPSLNEASFNTAPMSSGAYRLDRRVPGEGLRLSANPYYFRGRPPIQRIRIKVIPSSDSLVLALRAHDVDLVDNLPENSVRTLGAVSGVRIINHETAAYRHLDCNLRDPLLADVRVRTALFEAIDSRTLLRDVYHNQASLAVSDIFPSSWAAPHIPPYRYDVGDAGAQLEAAGFHADASGTRRRNGTPLALTIMSGTGNAASERAEIFLTDAEAKIGVRLAIKNLPASALFAQKGPLYTGRYQLAWMSDTRGPDPDNDDDWDSAAVPPNGGNTVFLRDALVDQDARGARTISDRGRRKALYQAEEVRLHHDAASDVFSWQHARAGYVGDLRGFHPVPFYSDFNDAYQWSFAGKKTR